MRISDVSPLTISKISNKELLSLHLRCHQLFGLIQKRKVKIGIEQLINAHSLIVKEMQKRGLQHNKVAEIDEFFELHEFRIHSLNQLIKNYNEIKTGYYIFLKNDQCFTNLPQEVRGSVYLKLKRLFERLLNVSIPIHFSSEVDGKPIFEIVLKARDSIKIERMQHEENFRERFYIDPKQAKILNSLPPLSTFDILIYEADYEEVAKVINCSKKIKVNSQRQLRRLFKHYDEPYCLFLTRFKPPLKNALFLTQSLETNYAFSLEDKLTDLADFVIINEFLSATGSFVYGKLIPDDLDLVVKTNCFNNSLQEIIQFLSNSLGMKIHLTASRFGANWDYIPLYDLVAKAITQVSSEFRAKKSEELDRQAKLSKKEDKIVPGRAFYPLKTDVAPIMGYRKMEIFSKQNFIEIVEKLKKKTKEFPKMYASKKYDGNRIVIHKFGSKALIYSDDGVDLTKRLHRTVEELLNFKVSNLVLDCELEMWDGEVKLPRENVAGWLHSTKDPEREKMVVVNAFDCLYYEDQDLHLRPLKERLEYLNKIQFKQSTDSIPDTRFKFNKTPNYLISSYEDAWEIIPFLCSQPYSEGVMLKLANSIYPLNGRTSEWIKFKIYAELHVVVIDKKETKTKGVFNYRVGILAENINVREKIEIEGLVLTPIGWIYNTKADLKIGDVITEKIHSLNLYKYEDGSIELSHYEPIFYERRERNYEQVDSVSSAIKIAKDAGIFNEKIVSSTSNQEDLLVIPPEEKTYQFVMQHHWRGRSVHIDFRVEKTGYLSGWTIADAIPGKVKEPIDTLEKAKEIFKENKAFKIDFETGKFVERKTRSGVIRKTSLYATTKAPEPLEWLEVEGVTEDVGATKNYPGVFHIIDKGTVEYGTHKPYFIEYFLNGKIFKGRIIFRLLGRRELVQETILPPSEEQKSPSPLIWLCIQPEDNTPYVLSARAERDKFCPPYQYSLLPKIIKDNIPPELKYWEIEDNDQRLEVLSKLRKDKSLVKRLVEIYDNYVKGTSVSNTSDTTFLLHRVFWKGRKVIRVGPTTEVFYLVIKPNLVFSTIYDLRKTMTDITFYEDEWKKSLDLEYQETTELSPGHELNPTKNTPCFIKTIDKGNCKILIDSDEIKRIVFDGKILKGSFHFIREKDAPFYIFSPANVPVSSFIKLNEEKRFVLGPALVPNALDSNGNIFPRDVIKPAAYSFIRDYIDIEKEKKFLKSAYILEVGVQRFENENIPLNSVFLTMYFEDSIPTTIKEKAFFLENNLCSFVLDKFDTEEEAEKVAWTILKELRKEDSHELFDIHHKYPVEKDKVILVESYLKKEETEELGLPADTWILGFLVLDDKLWYKIKQGEITSLSIYGYGTASQLRGNKYEIPRL